MFHLNEKPSPPRYGGRVTSGQAVDSSAMVMTPGNSVCVEVVEFFQEFNRLQMLAAAKLVGNPFAFLPRIIEVKHRSHRVHPQSVNVKAVEPEQRVGDEEIGNFMPAKIENQRAPILMRAFARVFVLEKRGAVEFRQRPVIARKMRRHPVHNHADARLVQRVDEKLKILRRAEAARGRVKAGDLITPRRIIRVLGRRHKFDVRETQASDVFNERFGQFAVAPGFVRRFFPPGTEVDFINAHGRAQRVALAALFQPGFVVPLELSCCPRRWRRFSAAPRRKIQTGSVFSLMWPCASRISNL